jgi:DAK2 domain
MNVKMAKQLAAMEGIEVKTVVGRSARLGERSRGVVDAGATSAALILQTFCKVMATSDAKSSSSGAETTRPEIPIARNANPAGLSTARPVQDISVEVEEKTGEKATAATPEIPIARNANPAGVSTARPRERGRGRPRHNVGRASSPVRLPKTAWKLAKLQENAPVCGAFSLYLLSLWLRLKRHLV